MPQRMLASSWLLNLDTTWHYPTRRVTPAVHFVATYPTLLVHHDLPLRPQLNSAQLSGGQLRQQASCLGLDVWPPQAWLHPFAPSTSRALRCTARTRVGFGTSPSLATLSAKQCMCNHHHHHSGQYMSATSTQSTAYTQLKELSSSSPLIKYA